jgi:hypothetical protein
MTGPSLTIDTPAGTVHAAAGHRQADAVVFELSGAVRGSVHVTGTHRPDRWDRFTAVRACLGPVDAFQATAPDDALPRLALSRTGYRGSLTLYRDDADRPQERIYPAESTAGRPLSEKAATTLTAVLRACAGHVAQHPELPEILGAARQRDTPALLRFLDWSAAYHQAEAARHERQARTARVACRATVAAWWTTARWFAARPHPVLLLMLADYPGSLARTANVQQWLGPYCLGEAARQQEHARRAQAEAASLRVQQQRGPRRATPVSKAANANALVAD